MKSTLKDALYSEKISLLIEREEIKIAEDTVR
jgi:hypothetical protein